LKIAIATLGRFHVLDLARELTALGHEVHFYSYVPKTRAIRFGLAEKCYVALLPWLFPLVGLQWLLGYRGARFVEPLMYPLANILVRWRLKPCDVFIGMSGIYFEAAIYAKNRYGAKVILERGSRHILSQREILAEIPGARGPSNYVVRRELAGYVIADRISIPSRHVADSFMEHHISADRLMVNPYGVDLSKFRVESPDRKPKYDVIFVGVWSMQKGADILLRAMQSVNRWNLLHVGRIGDITFPKSQKMVSAGTVDQLHLPQMYRQARVLVLPSRQEGLSLVLIQALACGIPIVCTDRTGGGDLRDRIQCRDAVIVVRNDDIASLIGGIREAMEVSQRLHGKDLLGKSGRENLTWAAYGRRYDCALRHLFSAID